MTHEVIETDVLVVGSGVAGFFAAIRAKEAGVDVVVVDKAQSGFSGASAHGAQNIRVMFPGDDLDDYAKESIVWSDYLADQDIVYAVVGESHDRFQDLLKWGVEFMRDENGEIKTLVSDKPYTTSLKTRYVYPDPPSRPTHMGRIKREALRLGVRFIDRVMITDLLTSDSRIAGAVGFNVREGRLYRFVAKAVVLATGTFHLPPTHVWYPGAAGMTMAMRAGAELINMEQGKSFNVPLKGQLTSLGPYYFDGEEWWGQKFINAKGEEFLEQYELMHRLPGRRHWGPPWRLFIPAIVQEWKAGKGPCYQDFSGCLNYWERMRKYYGGYVSEFEREWNYLAKIRGDLPLNEFRKVPIELIAGGPGYEGRGGIRVSVNSETRVPGLYAAGIATDTAGGAGYTNAASFTACFTQGHRAGIHAAEFAKTHPRPVVREKQARELERVIYAPLERTEGSSPDDLLVKLALISYRYTDVIKSAQRLKKGIEEIEELKVDAERLTAKDYHYLAKCDDAKSTVELWGIMARTSLMREESRGDHYREDYPLMDNDKWLKWLAVSQGEGAPRIVSEEIPFKEKNWKYRPEPGMVNLWRRRNDAKD
jgi:succinate dehydrogenase/fumarate reductase flavoprotein subunit